MALFENGDLSELREVFMKDRKISRKSEVKTGRKTEVMRSDLGKKNVVKVEPIRAEYVLRTEPAKKPGGGQSRRPRITSVEDLEEVIEPEKWTFSSSAQSLSTALNDPSNRELDLFTKTWGSYFTPTASLPYATFPPIGLPDFLCYLRDTNAGRKLHRALVRQLSKDQSNEEGSGSIEDFRPLSSHLLQDGRSYSLDTIPRVFYLHDFSLADPATFQEVLPLARLFPKKKMANTRSPLSRVPEERVLGRMSPEGNSLLNTDVGQAALPPVPPSPEVGSVEGVGSHKEDRHASMMLLHEKLTHYLDVVEVHLAYQISQKSDVFFSTLTSQQELESYIMLVRQDVMELRYKLRALDKDSTHRGLYLYSQCRRKQRLKVVYEKVRLVATVQQTQPTIQLLLKSSDFVGALDLIMTTQDVLQQELHGIHALRHLGSQLSEIETLICRMMEADLVEYAMQDVRTRLEQPLDYNPADHTPSETEERLSSVVLGLLRQGKLHFLPSLREALLVFLKAKVKGVIAGYLQQEEGGDSGVEPPSLADCMRSMGFQAWLDLLHELFDRVLHFQKAIKGCIDVIRGVCLEAAGLQTQEESPSYPAMPTATPTATPTALGSIDSLLTENSAEGTTSTGMGTADGDGLVMGRAGPGEGVVLGDEGVGLGVMERFEAQSLAQEAEDMLDQLVMDDELSDARLVGVALSHDLDTSSDLDNYSTSVDKLDGWNVGVASVNGGVVSGNGRTCSTGRVNGGVASGRGFGDRDDDLLREAESTVDPAQRHRLEDQVRPARCTVLPPLDGGRLVMECEQLVSATCDLVHTRCVKVLTLRAKTGLLATLPPHDFLDLIHSVEGFIRGSASQTGRQCPQLRVALLSQGRAFLDQYHDNCRKNLSLLLESERWRQSDVPVEVQALVHRLETGAGLQLPQAAPTIPSSQPPAKYLVIHGTNFAVLGTVLLLVKRLLEYSSYADSLPMLINEIMTKLIDIIKYFNTRTCELVLGAGAMNAVGLKNITARHLAIMLRCLQAVSLLVPDLKMYFQTRLSKQQHVLLIQFDTVTMDLAQHCERLQTKLQVIMDEVMNKCLSKWDAKPPVPSPCFKNIVKKIVKLHENVVDILPPQQVELLFANIEVAFRVRLKEHLGRLGIRNDGSARHGVVNRELHHLEGAVSSMDNVSAFGSSLFDVWTES